MGTTDPDMWRCARCGLRLRDCRCCYGGGVLLAMLFSVAVMLLATPVRAQCDCELVPEPIIVGPGPCHSDMPHWCYPHRVWLPILAVAP